MQFLQGLSITNGIIVIQDYVTPASSAPTFAVTPVTSSVNEGANVTFNITGTNIPATTTYYWSVQGNTGSSISTLDFAENVGSIQITNNAASFIVSPTSDVTTEGSELFTVALRANTTTGTILATSSSVTINDTSLSPASYTVTPASSSVNEGSALTFNVSGSYISDGTYYWTISNGTSSNTDFSALSGSFTITSNAGSFTITPTADLLTEGSEVFTAAVRTGSTSGNIVATSSSVTINDTSLSVPVYAVTPTSSSVNEGSALTFNVSGSNIINGTYYWTVNNVTSSNVDFSANSGSFTITSNAGSFDITPLADILTEGSELFTASVRTNSITGNVVATSSSVTINDTSLSIPVYAVTPAASNVNEGTALTFNVTGSNIINGTYYWTVNNLTSSNIDFTATSGSFSITSNAGSFNVTANADLTTEGAELYTASVRTNSITGNIVATSSSVTINDTSVNPAVNGSFYIPGEGAVITVPDNVMLGQDLPFTTEWWFKGDPARSSPSRLPVNVPGMAVYGYWTCYGIDGGSYYIAFTTQSSYNRGYLSATFGAGAATTPAVAISYTDWNHWALTGDGTYLRLYCNGILCNAVPYNYSAYGGQAAVSGTPWQIGATGVAAYGWITDVRHVRGTVVYTGNFTPPNKWLSPGGNAAVYSNTANVNTTFSSANCGVLIQRFNPANEYKILDSSNYAADIHVYNGYDYYPSSINLNSIQGNTTIKPYA